MFVFEFLYFIFLQQKQLVYAQLYRLTDNLNCNDKRKFVLFLNDFLMRGLFDLIRKDKKDTSSSLFLSATESLTVRTIIQSGSVVIFGVGV